MKCRVFMKINKSQFLLYAITDRGLLKDLSLSEAVKGAVKGGADIIQLREKKLNEEDFLNEALIIRELCAGFRVPLIINDNINIALKADADGVHLGQKDLDVSKARRILGADKIIGVSAHSVEEALKAEAEGADYLGCGAVFATGSKKDAAVIDHNVLKEICASVQIPVVAIGGITKDNIKNLSGTGISGIAVISAIFAQEDIEGSAVLLKRSIKRVLKDD